MDILCAGCHAQHWASESSAKKPPDGEASYESYCKQGKALIEIMCPLSEPLNTLMCGDNARPRSFPAIQRRWNELFAFTSIKFKIDTRMNEIGTGF